MLNIFNYAGKSNNDNKHYQFWIGNYHTIELHDDMILMQKMDYLHTNPVTAGMVWEPWHYKYSSAIDYYTNEKGLIRKLDLI